MNAGRRRTRSSTQLQDKREEDGLPGSISSSDDETSTSIPPVPATNNFTRRHRSSESSRASRKRRKELEASQAHNNLSPVTLSTYQKKKKLSNQTNMGSPVSKRQFQNTTNLSHFANRNAEGLTTEIVLQQVSIWQESCISNPDQFAVDVTKIVFDNYPTETRSLLDQVLSMFVLFHPEHMNAVLQPVVEMMVKRKLKYSRKHPPFYSFLNLFTYRDSQTEADQIVQREILAYLIAHNRPKKEGGSMLLSPFISDCLVEGGADLQTYYFHMVMTNAFSSKLGQTNPSDHVISVIEEQVYRQCKFQLASSALPLVLEYDPRVAVYGPVLQVYFANVSVSQSKKIVHQIIFFSPTTKSQPLLAETFIETLIQLLPPSDWFLQHFFPHLLQSISDQKEDLQRLLLTCFRDPKYHVLLFGKISFTSVLDLENKKYLEQFVNSLIQMDYASQKQLISLWETGWSQLDSPSLYEMRLQAFVSLYPIASPELRPSLHVIFAQLLRTFVTQIFFLPLAKTLLQTLVQTLFSTITYLPLMELLAELFIRSKKEAHILELQNCISFHLALVRIGFIRANFLPSSNTEDVPSNTSNNPTSNSSETIYMLNSLVNNSKETLIAQFFQQMLVRHPSSLEELFHFVQSNLPETRTAVLQIFASLPDLSSFHLWDRHTNLYLLLTCLIDPFPAIHESAKLCFRRIVASESIASSILSLLLQRLYQLSPQTQSQSFILIQEIGYLLSSFPPLVQTALDSISVHLNFPTDFINTMLDIPLSMLDGNEILQLSSIQIPNQIVVNVHALSLLNYLLSAEVCTPSVELVQHAMTQHSTFPDVRLLQYKLAETCLEQPNYCHLVSLSHLIEGIFSTSQMLRELCATILMKQVTWTDSQHLMDVDSLKLPQTAKRKTFSFQEIQELILFRIKYLYVSEPSRTTLISFVTEVLKALQKESTKLGNDISKK